MAKVFLSYDRDDTERARPIALALEKAGHSVWWDLHIRGGAQYTKVIEEALAASHAVVVLWSAHSIESAWVRDEAAAGRDSGRLVPIHLDGATPPMGFRQFQGLDFSGWKGRGKPAHMDELLTAIETIAGQEIDQDRSVHVPIAPVAGGRRPLKWSAAAVLAIVTLAVAGLFYQSRRDAGEYTIAVTAADNAARPLARDLLVNLGRLQSVHTGAVRLIGPSMVPSDKPDLVYEVANDSDETQSSASLLLMKDRSVLWSSDFLQPSGRLADLKQQLAFTAGRVLECAFDAREGNGRALKQQALKIYLNACAQLPEIGQVSSPQIIAGLLQVTREAPRFEGGWAKLLVAESQSLDPGSGTDRARRAELRQHIEMSRRIDPDLPEIDLAEFAEIGAGHLARQSAIIDRAKSRHPDNPQVLGVRALFLLWVGRSREAINDSRRAVELDPLSPARRNDFISALMYSGRIESAHQELEEANRLWPDTESIRDIRFRFNLRYGDPKLAAGMMSRSGGPISGPVLEAYIRARLDPTAANVDRVIASFPASEIHNPPAFANLIQAMGEFHREDALFRLTLQPARRADLASVREVLFRPGLATFRHDPRFMQVANLAGLVDYWRSTGHWPDFCYEPDLPYDCKKEAAKLGA